MRAFALHSFIIIQQNWSIYHVIRRGYCIMIIVLINVMPWIVTIFFFTDCQIKTINGQYLTIKLAK